MHRLRVSSLGHTSHGERPNIVQTWCIAQGDMAPSRQHLVTPAVSLGSLPVVVWSKVIRTRRGLLPSRSSKYHATVTAPAP